MPAEVERPGSPIPMIVLVGLAVLGVLWIIRVVVGLIWTLVQVAVLVVIVVVVAKVLMGRQRRSRSRSRSRKA